MANILLVDDSATVREMVSFTLDHAGYQVIQAENGTIALEMARNENFDLVITDLNMAHIDGITLTKELRLLANHKSTPILILTTEAGADKKYLGKQIGATGWIEKPFDPDHLLSTIKHILQPDLTSD